MPIPAAKECPPDRKAKLVIVRASDQGREPDSASPGSEFKLDRSPVVFGMSTSGLPDKRDIALYIEGLGRPHAYFELRDRFWYVVDAGSPSGTWVGGSKVSEHKLSDGDRVALGAIGNRSEDDGSGVVLEFTR